MRSTTNSMRGEIRVPVLGMRARGDAERRRHKGPRSSLTRALALSRAAALALGALLSASIGVGSLHPTGANAGFPNQLPFMCFNTDHTFHQTFGPISFFLNENQQGPTSFEEAPPTSKPVVVLPLRRGTAAGHLVYYVITDASDLTVAQDLGVNFTPKLANAAGTSAVQRSSSSDPTSIDVPAGVDFSPEHVLVASATGFPPSAAAPGAIGDAGYSPLVELPRRDKRLPGVVLNAPQIGDGANTNGGDKAHWADKVESVDAVNSTVSYDETNGCYEDKSVHYASFDSSAFGPAAIEDVTYAPALGGVPFIECGTNDINVTGPFINRGCARESLIAFINGQTGKDNIQRQGLNAAILDQESPLNILEDVPNNAGQFNYSPMWDIHLVRWNDSVPVADRLRQTDFARAEALIGTQAQSITPAGTASNTFQATGFIVNCPLISIFADK